MPALVADQRTRSLLVCHCSLFMVADNVRMVGYTEVGTWPIRRASRTNDFGTSKTSER